MAAEQKTEEKKYPKVVTGIYIFNNKGEMLLVRAPHWANKLTIPGGHVEYRELAQDTAVREVKEETGLDVKDLELLKVWEMPNPKNYGKNSTHLVTFHYKAKMIDENQPVVLDEREGLEYIWIKPEEALKRDDLEESLFVHIPEDLLNKKEKKSFFGKSENQKYEDLKKECDEYKNGWQRALADYKNLQAETAKRRSEWAQMSEQQIIEEFIPVYDHLKLAINNEQLTSETDPWIIGVKHVLRQFVDILKNHGVEEIKTVGEKFNPSFHEAVGEEESEGKESGIIVKEIMSGYKMGERVIRAARVVVSK